MHFPITAFFVIGDDCWCYLTPIQQPYSHLHMQLLAYYSHVTVVLGPDSALLLP